ncbi:MAG: hypothetical protein ACK5QT_01585 [Oligoflexia bacterium]
MTRLLYNLMFYYPVWAMPLSFAFFQIALYLRGRGSKLRFAFWAAGLIILGSAVGWILFRGDIHGERWLKDVLGVRPVTWQ